MFLNFKRLRKFLNNQSSELFFWTRTFSTFHLSYIYNPVEHKVLKQQAKPRKDMSDAESCILFAKRYVATLIIYFQSKSP